MRDLDFTQECRISCVVAVDEASEQLNTSVWS